MLKSFLVLKMLMTVLIFRRYLSGLGNEQINELFIEAGATLAGQFMRHKFSSTTTYLYRPSYHGKFS